MIEYSEDWIKEKNYIKQEKLIVALDEQKDLVEAQVFLAVYDGEVANFY